MKKVFVISLSILFLAGFFKPTLSQDKILNQLEKLFNACDKPGRPGGFAVAVLKDGRVIFKKAYGFANFENKIPFTTTSVVNYASVAKQFTGFAIARLIQEGKLHMEDDIRDYLSEIPDFGHKITIGHLLHHTSGIRDWVALVKISGRYENDVITNDFIMKLIKHQKELNFKPGEQFQYSNNGYFLLAEIISRVTGKSFCEWTQENIFKLLHMDNTRFIGDYREIIMDRADCYKADISGDYLNCPSHKEGYGSSSLFSTLEDMIKWVQNFESRAVGDDKLWKMMLEEGILNDSTKVDYGFGLELGKRYGQRSFGHGGSWCGALSQVSYYPDLKLATILISNRDPSGVYVDEKVLNLFLDYKAEEVAGKNNQLHVQKDLEIDPALLQEYTGIYKMQNWIIGVEKADNDLIIHQPWGEQYKVYPESDSQFYHKDVDLKFSFLRNNNNEIDRMIYTFKGSDNPPFQKLPISASQYPEISEMCGEYTCQELQTTYTLQIQDDHLIAAHLQNENVLLIRIDQDYYQGDQWWFKVLKFERDENGGIKGFRLNADSNNIQNLLFTRIRSTEKSG